MICMLNKVGRHCLETVTVNKTLVLFLWDDGTALGAPTQKTKEDVKGVKVSSAAVLHTDHTYAKWSVPLLLWKRQEDSLLDGYKEAKRRCL